MAVRHEVQSLDGDVRSGQPGKEKLWRRVKPQVIVEVDTNR